MAKQIIGLDKAKALWGTAKDGKLDMAGDGVPYLSKTKQEAEGWAMDDHKAVKIYILVEDE